MSAKQRVPKDSKSRLSECETHLYFLWDARRLYQEQQDRYKQVASELRILVADHKPKRRLLMAMMGEFDFSYDVQPPPPPFDKQPIPMVGWRDDPNHIALTQEVQAALGNEKKMEEMLEKHAALRRAVPFSEYCDSGLAVYIAPHDYSFNDLVLAIAQQIGSSHEDTAVDVPLTQMGNIILGGEQSHIAALVKFADLVLTVGTLFIGHVVANHDYEPVYFRFDKK